ncbi:MAG: 50S ribosomal protein L9 [Fimbriimonadaceae bacterium]|nr:50S ribosomal protein L9 [Fimbriimonadaceae bacterium]
MKVILKQTLPKVGKEGQVVSVKPGFARNYLFPNGLAIIADKTQVKALEARMARLSAKLAETKAEAEAQAAKLHHGRLLIEVKAGEGGRLFGAITADAIAEAVQKQFGISVDRKQVAMLQPIKRLGNTPIEIDLHRQVDCAMTVVVYDPAVELPAELLPKAEAEAEEAPEEEA